MSDESTLEDRAKIDFGSYRSRLHLPKAMSVTVELPGGQQVIVELEADGTLSVCAYNTDGDEISDLTGFEHGEDGWEQS
jgi:hypothetical protein